MDFFGIDDVIFYLFCFDVNGGVFEMLFFVEDVIILDELNYVLIIDGIWLFKVCWLWYCNCDMVDFEE